MDAVADVHDALAELRAEGFTIAALERTPDAVGPAEVPAEAFPLALVLGNEVPGVPPDVLAAADRVVGLPQYGVKASLNVSVAFGRSGGLRVLALARARAAGGSGSEAPGRVGRAAGLRPPPPSRISRGPSRAGVHRPGLQGTSSTAAVNVAEAAGKSASGSAAWCCSLSAPTSGSTSRRSSAAAAAARRGPSTSRPSRPTTGPAGWWTPC